jgi:hypothetical protein
MDNSRTGTNWPVLLFNLFIYFCFLPCDSCHVHYHQDWRRPWNRTFNVKQHWLQFAHSHHKSHDPHCVCYLSDLLLFYFFHPKRYSVLSLLTCGFLDAMGRRSPWLALAPRWSSLTNHGHARPSWPSHHLIWQLGSLCVGLDEMLVARWFARFMVSSARLGFARLNFLRSWADILARFVNEPARELPYSSKTKLYAYHLQNNWWTCYIYVKCLWPMN